MKIDGSCHCGKIAFTAEVDPATVRLCHCTDCQILSGGAYRANVPAPAASFVLLRGAPKIYIKTTAENGNPRAHAFCPDCGTPIYAAAVADPQVYSLRLGSIKQRRELQLPQRQNWIRSALPWSMDLRAIEGRERQ